jgi:hypothetical protein
MKVTPRLDRSGRARFIEVMFRCLALVGVVLIVGCAPAPLRRIDVDVPSPSAAPVATISPVSTVRGATPPPANSDWSGEYFDPIVGQIMLNVQKGKVAGKWVRPTKDRYGELAGDIDGLNMRFSWTERQIGLVGPSASRSGHGSVVISHRSNSSGSVDVIDGAFEEDAGGSSTEIHAVKQANALPPNEPPIDDWDR